MTLQDLKELVDEKIAENPDNAQLELYKDEPLAGAREFFTRLNIGYVRGNIVYENLNALGLKMEVAKNPEAYKKAILL